MGKDYKIIQIQQFMISVYNSEQIMAIPTTPIKTTPPPEIRAH